MRRLEEALCMAEHYHHKNDLKWMREMRKLAPDDFNAGA
jgi:hypothetical protein